MWLCRCISFVVLVVIAPTLHAAESRYVHPELLLDPSELARPEVANQHVILDVRKQEAYDKSHVPGAFRVDHDAWKSAFGDGADAEGWSQRIGDLGIDADSQVVLYDDASSKDAARIWWILRYWGVDKARLLNGGWKAWAAAGLPTSTEDPGPPANVPFTAKPRRQDLVTKDQILASLDDRTFQILDTRSDAEYCGTDLKSNKRGGAIPGAIHLEWSNLIDADTDRFKSADELKQVFQKAGVDLNKRTASHCQTGGRASVMVFGLELMGAKDPGNYYASWSEWGNLEDTPIVVPDDK